MVKGGVNSVSGQKLIRPGHLWRKSRLPLELDTRFAEVRLAADEDGV